ncbi:MAG: hypothetical protein JWL61_5028 [Gemmatimonadetes bacterium]|nr:hypothetical protein [Gemmatimonadota bacterium]
MDCLESRPIGVVVRGASNRRIRPIDVCAECGWLKAYHDANGHINISPVVCYGFRPTIQDGAA